MSEVDPRPRHRGVSHHTLTALGRVALARADVVLPVVEGAFGRVIMQACRPLAQRHRLVEVGVDGLREALAGSPAPLSSMGRGFDDDPVYFLAGAAAGRQLQNHRHQDL